MNDRKISVAICTCNGERFVEKQLNSILHQMVPVDEIILSDDCSADNTVTIATRVLQEKGITYRILRNRERIGITGNFEQAIRNCSGDVIFTSDQDDVWNFDKTAKVMDCFEHDRKCVMVFSDATVIDGDDQFIFASLYKKDGFMQKGVGYREYIDDILRLNYTVYGCTMAFRKTFIDRVVPFLKTDANHDAWIMCCAGVFGNVKYIPMPLISYRIHGENCVGSLAGNSKWESIIAKTDLYDQHFAIQELRGLRIRLLEEALNRGGGVRNRYTASCKRVIGFYKRLLFSKQHPKVGVWLLLVSFLDGSYYYRFCDRGARVTIGKYIKQFVCDICFVLGWRVDE